VVILCPNHHAQVEALYTDPQAQWSLTEEDKAILSLLRQKT